jgi:ADP-heptose:LPS heptosyltransferase
MDRILVSRTDGLGDLLLTTPLFNALRLKYPKAHISALVSSYASGLLANNPAVDEIVIYDRKKNNELVKKLKEGKYDAVIAVYPRPVLAWAFFLAGIPLRIGTSSRWYSFLYNKRVRMSRKKSDRHEADYNILLAGGLIGPAKAEKEFYYITQREKQAGCDLVEKKGIKGGFIIVHPGSKGSAWNLTPAKYTDLVSCLLIRGYKVLLTGGPSEKSMLAGIMVGSKTMDGIHILDENLGLREFAAVISQAKAVISCSTGPMHIAAALGVKTLSFFPPDERVPMKPSRWGPLGNIHEIIQPTYNDEGALDSLECDFIESRLKTLLERK